MYLRSTPRRNKDGSEVRYLQLAHNVWDPAAKRSRVQVVYNFGREEPATREALERLVASVARHLEPGKARPIAAEGLEFAESRPLGGTHVLDALWERLGIGPALRELLKGRRLDPAAERVLFALVANRALAPSSKLAAARWASEDVLVSGPAGDERRRVLPGDGLAAADPRGPGEARLRPGLPRFSASRSTCCSSTPPVHVLRDGGGRRPGRPRPARQPGPGRRRGRRRGPGGGVPDLGQVQGPPRRPAPGRDRHGRHPRRHPAARLVLAREHQRLGADPPGQGRHARAGRCRGSSGSPTAGSPPPRTAATCARAGTTTSSASGSAPAPPRRSAALSRQGRYQDVAENLRVKEVRIAEDERFVICHSPEGAERDAAIRARMIAQLKELIDGTDALQQGQAGRTARRHLDQARA